MAAEFLALLKMESTIASCLPVAIPTSNPTTTMVTQIRLSIVFHPYYSYAFELFIYHQRRAGFSQNLQSGQSKKMMHYF
ncbi:hypothetical protein SDC9_182222 [bioreactor metagenome]|uniref:Uncharacterized protein n=1 Tax=bioreactor metagenome TaxID=1076179 RepID=A0A645H6Y8_9ZZZZ